MTCCTRWILACVMVAIVLCLLACCCGLLGSADAGGAFDSPVWLPLLSQPLG